MTKTLLKDTLRSVTKNKLRFISIIVIVALGISFFVGIKSASPVMRDKANEYFRENNLFDVRITSPIAFTDDDINKIAALNGVENIVKSQYVDCIAATGKNTLVDTNGASFTCRIRELDIENAVKFNETGKADSSYVNRLDLDDGRYPEKEGECVIDFRAASIYDGLQIGDTISVIGDNESITDSLSVTSFVIVGTVSSPMYISVDRGNTNIGSGTLSTFMYVYPNSFSSENVNELFIKTTDSDSYDKFSDTYDTLVSNLSYEIKDMSSGIIDSKLASLKADYASKISDKQAELKAYQVSSDKQLADKKKSIDEFKTYVDSEDEILAAAQKKYESEVSSANTSLTNLQSQFSKLNDTYEADKKSFDNQSSEIKGYSELKSLYDDLNSKHSTDSNNLDSLKSTLDSASNELDSRKKDADKYKNIISDLNSEISSDNSKINSLQSDVSSLNSQKSSFESQISGLNSDITSIQRNIDSLEEKSNAGTITAGEIISLSAYRVSLSRKNTDLNNAKNSLSDVNSSIDSKNSSISSLQSEVSSAQSSLSEANSNYNSAAAQVNLATTQYNNALSNYTSAKTSYDQDSTTLSKYLDSMNQLTSGKSNLQDLSKKIETEEKQLAQLKINVTVAQIKYTLTKKDGDTEVTKAQSDLNAAKLKYDTIDNEYTTLQDEINTKLKDLNGDLKKLNNLLKNADSVTWEATPQTAVAGNVSFSRSLDNVHSMSRVFPILFLLTAMIACFVIMTRNIEEERSQIGILKALGYANTSIFLKYLIYSLAAWVFGAIIGVVLGACFFPKAIFSIYSTVYSIPKIVGVFNRWYISYGLLFSVAATIVATLAASTKELIYKPAILMQPKNINYSRRTLLEHFPVLWGRLSYGMVFVTRAVSRSRRRVLVGTIGIACCTALILSAFGLANSTTAVSNSQYSKDGIFKYDVQLVLESEQNSSDSDILNAVKTDGRTSNAMLISNETATAAVSEDKAADNRSAHIITFDDTQNVSDFINLRAVSGSVDLSNGAVISEKLAEDIGASVGSTIYLTGMNGSVHTAKVTGIVENYINNYIYFSNETYENVFLEKPALNYIICTVKNYLSSEDINKFASDYLKNEEVTGAATSEVMSKSIDASLDRVIAVVSVFIISACVLAAIVMYTVANINISERLREVANIKVVGFSDSEVLFYVSRENIISTVFGIVIGLLIGFFSHKALVGLISVDTVMYNSHIFWWSYIATVLIVAAVAIVASLPIVIKIKNINMAETMKSLE